MHSTLLLHVYSSYDLDFVKAEASVSPPDTLHCSCSRPCHRSVALRRKQLQSLPQTVLAAAVVCWYRSVLSISTAGASLSPLLPDSQQLLLVLYIDTQLPQGKRSSMPVTCGAQHSFAACYTPGLCSHLKLPSGTANHSCTDPTTKSCKLLLSMAW